MPPRISLPYFLIADQPATAMLEAAEITGIGDSPVA
jgi:hypothetical protein